MSAARVPMGLVRLTEVIGKNIKSRDDAKIGEVTDAALDVANGRASYVVASFGGILGIGDRLFAVPWSSLSIVPGGENVVVQEERQKLSSAPGFDRNRWPAMSDPAWSSEVRTFYGDPTHETTYVSELRKADEVIGARVNDAKGERLGKIEDIVVDSGTGRVIYAVLSFGGVMGIGDRLFAIPLQSISLPRGNGHATIASVTKDRLRDAPGFDKSAWPNMADPRWGSTVASYWSSGPPTAAGVTEE